MTRFTEDTLVQLKLGKVPVGAPAETRLHPLAGKDLVFIYPKEGSIAHNNPAGIVQAPWVTAEQVEAAYGASGADATRWEVAAFLDDMPRRFAEADLILCRSGASTVAELAAAGKAAVLVPLPTAADNHQLRNAEVFAAAGAAWPRDCPRGRSLAPPRPQCLCLQPSADPQRR